MRQRSSATWLVGVLLLLTGLGLAGSLIRYRLCGTCDGLALYMAQVLTHPRPLEALPRVDCPDCGDHGKVSLFKSWMRPKVADSVAAILQGLSSPSEGEGRNALILLIHNEGKNTDDFKGLTSGFGFTGARFMEVEGKQVLILILDTSPPKREATAVVLVTPEGQVLDYLQVSGNNGENELRAAFLEKPAEDGAQLAILPPRGILNRLNGLEPQLAYRLDQWNRPSRHFSVPWKGMPGELICPLRIRGDRLECLR